MAGSRFQKWDNERLKVGTVKQVSCDPRRVRSIKIALFVADHEAVVDVHRIALKQSFDHSRLRLAAGAENSVLQDLTIRMVRAKFERIDMRTNEGQFIRHPFMQMSDMMLLVQTSGDS